jgi:hypothetical protein
MDLIGQFSIIQFQLRWGPHSLDISHPRDDSDDAIVKVDWDRLFTDYMVIDLFFSIVTDDLG